MWTDSKGRQRTDQADLEDTRARIARAKRGRCGVVLPVARLEAMITDEIVAEEEYLRLREAITTGCGLALSHGCGCPIREAADKVIYKATPPADSGERRGDGGADDGR